MKILMIAPYPEPGKPIEGGVEAVTYSLIDGFKDHEGFEMIVLSAGREKTWSTKIDEKITIKYLSKKFRNRKLDLIKHVKPAIISLNLTWHPDIIHIQGNGTMYLLYDKSYDNKIIMTPHAVITEEIRNTKSIKNNINRLTALCIELYRKRYIRNLIFISDFIKSKLNNEKATKGIYENIFDPVSLNYFNKLPEAKINKNQLNIFFIGSIIPLKGLDYLIIALSNENLKGKIKLHIAGNFGDKHYESDIMNLIDRLDLKNDIVFHGRMKSEDIINFNSYDVLVSPSHIETFGCVVAEAMSMGKIVMASNVGAIPELITDGVDGFLFEDKNSNAIANKISYIFSMTQEEIENIRQNAREKAFNQFHPKVIARKHLDFYNRFLRNK